MENVSGAWAPYAAKIKPEALIEFELIDVDAAKLAGAAVSVETAGFASLAQSYDEITQMSSKIATLEPDYWALDSTFILPKKDGPNGETGWWSKALSGADGGFDVAPVLTFTFSEPQYSDGFTIVFDNKSGEVGSDFSIETYSGTTLLASAAVSGNGQEVRVVDCPSAGYDRLVITVTKTSKPYRRLRICEVVFGYLQQFDADKIVSLKLTKETSLYMQSLAAGKLAVTIDNSDKAYNVLNPEGIYKFLQQGQGINSRLVLNGESVNTGRFYFDNATANDDALTATINAYDLIYRLDQAECNIGASGTWTVSEAVAAVIADSGIDLAVDIPAEIGARAVRKCIPQGTTHREALRLIAQAGMCHIFIDRLDRLAARDLDFGQSVDELAGSNMTTWGDAKDTGLINVVEIEAADEYSEAEALKFTATNRKAGEPLKVLSLNNPLINAQAVAEWILGLLGHRNQYNAVSMGNPARDLGDCVSIANVYGGQDPAVVIKQETTFNGSLLDKVTAYGG